MLLKDTINNIVRDEYGRPSAILALNKPTGISSHDLVDQVRKKLETRKVGHAGALDVFADGVMLVLVGKSTKKANELLDLDKKYRAEIILGVSTGTQDSEGEIVEVADSTAVTADQVESALDDLRGGYDQYVSLYSSVKVDGNKLRVLMRDDRLDKTIGYDKSGRKHLLLTPRQGESVKKLDITVPSRQVKLFSLKQISLEAVAKTDLAPKLNLQDTAPEQFMMLTIEVHCSKGTYVRQLAEDIGDRLGLPSSLYALTRTAIADVDLKDTVDVDSLA